MPDVTKLLTIGPVHTLTQNVVYAMPARSTRGYASSSTIEGNNVNSSTGMAAITGTEFVTAAPFIRTTAATTTVRLVAEP